jgi:serpin B
MVRLLGNVLHKTFVSVDEKGTDAAATEVVLVTGGCLPDPPVEVTIDCSFIFPIRDLQMGAVLFRGRVMNPGSYSPSLRATGETGK